MVATVSLGSHAVFHYHRYRLEEVGNRTTCGEGEHGGKSIDTRPILSILLEPRSLIITAKDLYQNHLHAIEPVERDAIGRSSPRRSDPGCNLELGTSDCPSILAYQVANWELLGDEETRNIAVEGGVLYRKTRVSLTCRDVERILPGKALGFG